MTLIPEILIYDNLIKIFNYLKLDYAAHSEPNTMLYHIFKTDINSNLIKFNKTDYFTQAKSIFIDRSNDNPRKIQVGIGFNQERSRFPTIHIMIPSESPVDSPIGINEGYLNAKSIEEIAFIDQEANTDEILQETSGGKFELENNFVGNFSVYTVAFQATYNLLITSDNAIEVMLIHLLLRSTFLSLKNQLEFFGFQNVKFGANDVVFNQDMVPVNVYSRNFNVSFTYDYSSRDIFARPLPTGMVVQGDMLEP